MTRRVNWAKRISILTSVFLLCAIFAGCTTTDQTTKPNDVTTTTTAAGSDDNFNAEGFPIVNKLVTKSFMIRKPPHIGDPAQMITFQKYEEMTNVKVNWDVVASDGFSERVNLVMASSTMPDAIMKGVPDITKTSADGSIINLSDLIANYSVGIRGLYEQYPEVAAAATASDGNMYALPSINTLLPNRTNHRNLWINQKWLDKLDLEIPETLDDFVEVMKAFRDQDPNGNGKQDEIPYVVENGGGNNVARVDNFAASWGLYPNMGYQLQIIDNKVGIYVTSEKFKEVLEFMHMLWEEKILDNALYTQTSDVSLSKFNSEISGCFGLSSDDLWNKYSNDYSPLPPPNNEKGDTPVIGLGSAHGGSAFVITKSDESPEITIRWIDYFYTDEGSRFIGALSESLLGITSQKLADGTYEYSDSILNDDRGISVALGEACPLPGGGFPYWRNENNSNYIYSTTVKKAVPIYEPYYQKDPAYAYPVFSVEESEKVNDIRRDLDVYLKECEAKFITGELSFDKWDEYVKTCEDLGIKDLEGYFQTAYDRMK